MKKRGFTLIELISAIIVGAVIVIITVPIILNVVDEAKDKADLDSAYAYIDAAKLYYYDAQLDAMKMADLETLQNIYSKIVVKGIKPEKGELYGTKNGKFALAVELRKKCYYKEFDEPLKVVKEYEECTLGWVGIDTTAPSIAFSYDGTLGNHDWYISETWVHITVNDNESGPSRIQWCMGEDCDPTVLRQNDKLLQKDILLTENKETIICAIGYDKQGNASEKECSKKIKIDTIAPEFSGIEDLTVMKMTTVDLQTGVTVGDNLSGMDGTFTFLPETIDTSIAGTHEIVYTAIDMAGNRKQVTRKIIIDALAPAISFAAEEGKINENGWAKEDFYVNITVSDQSGLGIQDFYVCTGNESDTCDPMTGTHITEGTTASRIISTEHNNNRICVKATDNNHKTSDVICSDAYKLDKTPPTAGTLHIQGTEGSNGWYVSEVMLSTNDGYDGLSGHNRTVTDTTSITSTVRGKRVVVTTYDNAGNSSTNLYTFNVDLSRLTTSVTFRLNSTSGSIYTPGVWTNQSVYALLSASGGTVDYYEASSDGRNYHKVTSSDTSFTRSGTYTVYYRAISVSGKIGVPTSGSKIMIDKDAPSTPSISFKHNLTGNLVSYTPGNWTYASMVSVSMTYTASDASGIDRFEYTVGNGYIPVRISSSGTSEPFSVNASGAFYARVVDKAGNVGPQIGPYSIKIDNQWLYPPTVTLTVGSSGGSTYRSGTWVNKQVCATLKYGQMGPSGFDHFEYSYRNTSTDSAWTKMSGYSMCFSQEGTNTVYFRTVNKAGRKGAITNGSTFLIDTTPPSAPSFTFNKTSSNGPSYSPGTQTDQNVYASIKATGSDVSGFDQLQCYRSDNSRGWTSFGTVDRYNNRIIISFTLSKEVTIKCRHTDKAGNLGRESPTYRIVIKR